MSHSERAITEPLRPTEPSATEAAVAPAEFLQLREARERWNREFEKTYLSELLERTGGNVSAAAELAGVDRVHLHRLLRRAGLRGVNDDD